MCVCVYNPKALQREFVRPNSRRVEKGKGGGDSAATEPKHFRFYCLDRRSGTVMMTSTCYKNRKRNAEQEK